MKALVLSSLFPNPVQRRHGIFIEHRVAATYSSDIEMRVVAPVPWFPSRNERWGRYAGYADIPRSAERADISIDHPRYLTVPKFGQTVAPALMAASLYRHIARLRRTFDFDVIDAYYLYPDGVAASWLAKMFDRPFIMSALGTDVSLIPNWRPSRRMIVEAIRRSSATTTVCKALAQELETIGAPAEKLHVVEHGVDLKMFSPPDDRMQLRLKLGFRGLTILSVGHLIERKGHDRAIRALAGLPEASLVIAGDGPLEMKLRQLAIDLGVGDRVRFLGHVEQRELPEIYGAADLTLLCSDREGIANVLLESIACGTPLVATPVWGSPDVITSPEAGLLTVDRSPLAIEHALCKIAANMPDRLATRRYAERYDWAETGRLHRALLMKAVLQHQGNDSLRPSRK
ncbi:glycosyltransferase [Novosphingobium guangzhouense]|uniref:Glycosyl transferase family 1 n=1 Tax=Novosphingobium guangzhouense TaxID=1850347 RepID=A0A2K2FWU9_9SPHN|nr:glycosyltransferase [Novosphingobium guangzhouense]PNU03266.1 hypothetical protein A8V01_24110 [Novosphingobium guangzhouense]